MYKKTNQKKKNPVNHYFEALCHVFILKIFLVLNSVVQIDNLPMQNCETMFHEELKHPQPGTRSYSQQSTTAVSRWVLPNTVAENMAKNVVFLWAGVN